MEQREGFCRRKRYRTNSEWQKASPGAYAAARRLSISDQAAEHLVYKSSLTPQWHKWQLIVVNKISCHLCAIQWITKMPINVFRQSRCLNTSDSICNLLKWVCNRNDRNDRGLWISCHSCHWGGEGISIRWRHSRIATINSEGSYS